MKTLFLTLSKKPFEVMASGEKNLEFRKPSRWIQSRLFNKDGSRKNYDLVKFVNGYGNNKPFFVAEYKGFNQAVINCEIIYSNNLVVPVKIGDYQIMLGKVTEKGNLHAIQ